MRGVIAHLGLEDFDKRNDLSAADMQTFLAKHDPLSFDQAKEVFLAQIGLKYGVEKREKYEDAFDNVGQAMYGRQWEYLKQIKVLEVQAKEGASQAPQQERRSVSRSETEQYQIDAILGQQDWLKGRADMLRPDTIVSSDHGMTKYTSVKQIQRGGVTIEYYEDGSQTMNVKNPVEGRKISYRNGTPDKVVEAARSYSVNANNYLTVESPGGQGQDGQRMHYFVDDKGTFVKIVEHSRQTPREGVAPYAQWEPDLRVEAVSDSELALMKNAFDTLHHELSNPIRRLAKNIKRRIFGRPHKNAA